tara:strand:+ start:23144 stop:23371 length:228 start_codon:yes stop_codon:yes gene_type:complete
MNNKESKEHIINALAQSDADLARVTEDLITVLVTKGAILFTDLPGAVQAKLLDRESLRSKLEDNKVSFLSEDETL